MSLSVANKRNPAESGLNSVSNWKVHWYNWLLAWCVPCISKLSGSSFHLLALFFFFFLSWLLFSYWSLEQPQAFFFKSCWNIIYFLVFLVKILSLVLIGSEWVGYHETDIMDGGPECFDCSDQNLTCSVEVHTRQSSPKPLSREVREHGSLRKWRHSY